MSRCLPVLFLLTALACGDEIPPTQPGRPPLQGSLVLQNGELAFLASDGRTLASGAALQTITLSTSRKIFPAAPGHCVHLSADQRISGTFLGLDKESLVFRTSWADRLAIPRRAARSLTHLSGHRTILREVFANPPLSLAPNKTRSFAVNPPLPGARVNVLFQQPTENPTPRCFLELDYRAVKKNHLLRVSLGGDNNPPKVDAADLPGTHCKVARSTQLRVLTVEHASGSLRIACDDEALWYTTDLGPCRLHNVRLTGDNANRSTTPSSVVVSTLTVEACEPSRRRPPADPKSNLKSDLKRDELWLASGDQLFGSVRKAYPDGLDLLTRSGTHFYAWKEVRAWYLPPFQENNIVLPKGPRIRIEFDSGLQPESDSLVGILTALDPRQATITHAALGKLVLPRSRIRVLRLIPASE